MKRSLAITLSIAALAFAGCQTATTPATPPATPPVVATTTQQISTQQTTASQQTTQQDPPVAMPAELKTKMTITAVKDYKPYPVMTVGLADDGFYPSDIRITAGTKVVFQNIDENGEHWPASDPHPIHNGLPGLDAKKALKYNEFYEYIFDKPGTYPMHDHLNPNFKAVVTVTE